MKPLVTCLILVMFLMTGGGEARGYELRGAGNLSCGRWSAQRSDGLHSAGTNLPDGSHYLTESWVAGFLSGMGYAGKQGGEPFHGVDNDGIFAWIDNYCRAHPIERLAEAVKAFSQMRSQ
jgi:hypothetical protein